MKCTHKIKGWSHTRSLALFSTEVDNFWGGSSNCRTHWGLTLPVQQTHTHTVLQQMLQCLIIIIIFIFSEATLISPIKKGNSERMLFIDMCVCVWPAAPSSWLYVTRMFFTKSFHWWARGGLGGEETSEILFLTSYETGNKTHTHTHKEINNILSLFPSLNTT